MESKRGALRFLRILRGHVPNTSRRYWNIHLEGASSWLNLAIASTGGIGLSKGFDLLRRRWHPLYPEITGYTIPTLLNLYLMTGNSHWETLALRCAKNLLQYRTTEGGIYSWDHHKSPYPVIFDTGQVIFGWVAVYCHTGNPLFLEAAEQSANWLIHQQREDGIWVKHQHLDYPKVIDARVDWALLELYKVSPKPVYQEAALRNLNWVLQNQHPDGWFSHCGFRRLEPPFTHTLAYTAEALFYSAKITNDERFMESARKTADALMHLQRPDGSLAGVFGKHWKEAEKSTCLTGNAQMSKLWMEMSKEFHAPEYKVAAEKSLEFLCKTQILETNFCEILGGIAGSYPIYGKYERFKYPAWACKFFIDALLTVQKDNAARELLIYSG